MITVSGLYIYPVKSCAGIALNTALVTDRGLQYDRRWMLIDENNRFISQRENASLALLKIQIENDGLLVTFCISGDTCKVPFTTTKDKIEVTIWDDVCVAEPVSSAVDAWLSSVLQMHCRLVYMPDDSKRLVETQYATNNEITSLSDGFPFLLISEASLEDLNNRMKEKIPMNRFRPNIVISGAAAFEEDELAHFSINSIDFFGVKLCARCPVPTINQDTLEKGKEPLKTLSTYRQQNNKVFFGQNLLHAGGGNIAVGDVVHVHKKKQPLL